MNETIEQVEQEIIALIDEHPVKEIIANLEKCAPAHGPAIKLLRLTIRQNYLLMKDYAKQKKQRQVTDVR